MNFAGEEVKRVLWGTLLCSRRVVQPLASIVFAKNGVSMSAKAKIVAAIEQKLAKFTQFERCGLGHSASVDAQIYALQRELAYLARIEGISKGEIARLRARYDLNKELAPKAEAVKIPPPPPREVFDATKSIPVLPKHQPIMVQGEHEIVPRRGREWYLWTRYCVHCDNILELEPRGYRCSTCLEQRAGAGQ